MANQQLVEYIKQQVQLGVAKDAIKNTLTTSGWPDADIMEAMGAASPMQAAAPAQSAAVARDIFPKAADVSAVKAEPAKKMESAASPFQAKIDARASSPAASSAPATMMSSAVAMAAKPAKSWTRFILPGVLGLIVLVLAGTTFYFYGQTNDLNDELTTGSQSNGDLTRQVASLTQEGSNKDGQIATLTSQNTDTALDLSFFIGSGSTSTVNATVKGTLKGDDKTGYVLALDNGIVLSIKNTKDPQVIAVLRPLLNNGLQVTASYVPGTRDIAVTAVNGTPIQVAVAAPTSTVTTASAPVTPPETSSTPAK